MSRLAALTRPFAAALALTAATLPPRPATAQTAAEKAATEYQRGKDAFTARQYEEARAAFERAYMLDPSPVLLYNLGRACEESGDAPKAIEYFQMYLDRTADTPDRGDVERRVRVMQAILAKTSPSPAPVPEPEPAPPSRAVADTPPAAPPPPEHTVLWPVGWGVLGAGVVAAGVGVAFGVVSADAEEDHKAATTGAEKKRTADDAESAALKANIGYAAGGVLIATGITLLVLDARDRGSDAQATGPRLSPAPGGGVVGWAGSF